MERQGFGGQGRLRVSSGCRTFCGGLAGIVQVRRACPCTVCGVCRVRGACISCGPRVRSVKESTRADWSWAGSCIAHPKANQNCGGCMPSLPLHAANVTARGPPPAGPARAARGRSAPARGPGCSHASVPTTLASRYASHPPTALRPPCVSPALVEPHVAATSPRRELDGDEMVPWWPVEMS